MSSLGFCSPIYTPNTRPHWSEGFPLYIYMNKRGLQWNTDKDKVVGDADYFHLPFLLTNG